MPTNDRREEEPLEEWLHRRALEVLGAELVAGATRFSILEVEIYYSGPGHEDPFVHGHPIQREDGTWYLHRAGPKGAHRGGTYKGMDVTFGPPDAYGGILVRAVAGGEETTEGPSLVVERVCAACGVEGPAALDALQDGRGAWEAGAPLHLVARGGARGALATPRVGLGLKRMEQHPTMPEFIGRPYRLVTDESLRKGRLQTIAALWALGDDDDAIRDRSRASSRMIRDHRATLEASARSPEGLDRFARKVLRAHDISAMYGSISSQSKKISTFFE